MASSKKPQQFSFKTLITEFEKEFGATEEPARQALLLSRKNQLLETLAKDGEPSGFSESFIESSLAHLSAELKKIREGTVVALEGHPRTKAARIKRLEKRQDDLLLLADIEIKLSRYNLSSFGSPISFPETSIDPVPEAAPPRPSARGRKRIDPVLPFAWQGDGKLVGYLYNSLIIGNFLSKKRGEAKKADFLAIFASRKKDDQGSQDSRTIQVTWIGTIAELGYLLKSLQDSGHIAAKDAIYKKAEHHFIRPLGKKICAKTLQSNTAQITTSAMEKIDDLVHSLK